MILRRFSLLILCASFAAAFVPAHAASRDDLKKVESEMKAQQQKAETLDQKARETSNNLQGLRQKLIKAAASLQARQEEQDGLEDRLGDLTQDIDAKNKSLKGEKEKLAIFTNALIELSRQPPETEFLQDGTTVDHIHRALLIRSVVPRIKEQTEAIARDIATLDDLHIKLAEQKHRAIAAQENLQGQQRDLDQLIKVRQGLLQRTEAQKESIARQLAALTGEAKDLHQLLDKVSPKAGRGKPDAFAGLQPSLRPPVAGSVTRAFGVKDADGVTSQGLTYAAAPGSPVVAPRAGKVVFAGPFRGYGQILILQHDGGYHSFMAGFGRIDADMGQEVAAGEPLGVLPVKEGGKGRSKAELYFEWRHNNEPIDPGRGIALSKGK